MVSGNGSKFIHIFKLDNNGSLYKNNMGHNCIP